MRPTTPQQQHIHKEERMKYKAVQEVPAIQQCLTGSRLFRRPESIWMTKAYGADPISSWPGYPPKFSLLYRSFGPPFARCSLPPALARSHLLPKNDGEQGNRLIWSSTEFLEPPNGRKKHEAPTSLLDLCGGPRLRVCRWILCK